MYELYECNYLLDPNIDTVLNVLDANSTVPLSIKYTLEAIQRYKD